VQPPQPPDGPSPEEQQAQAEMDLKNQEAQATMQLEMAKLQISIQEMQAKLGMEAKSQQQALSHAEDMHNLAMTQKREELKLKQQESKARAEAMKIAARNKPQAKK
jgi:hypothetical protein